MNTAEFLMIASSVVPDRVAMACDGKTAHVRRDAGPRQPPRQRAPGDGRRQGRQDLRHGAQLHGVRRGLLRRREARRRLRAAELPREAGRAHLHVQQLRDEGPVRRRALPRPRRRDQARPEDGRSTSSASTARPKAWRTTKTCSRSTSPRRSSSTSTTATRRSSSTPPARRRCRRASSSRTSTCPST